MAGIGYPVHNELQCSGIGNYRYLPENDMPDNLRREQEDQIDTLFLLDDNHEARQCWCNVTAARGLKCTGGNCPNRRVRIACPRSCGPQCDNNPWVNDSWAVGRKIHLKDMGGPKGVGMFASKIIRPHEYIGEYTGRVLHDSQALDKDAQLYSFSFTSIEHALDTQKQGSAVRCINHSCDPNCVVCEYVYDHSYHLVAKSKKTIHPGEELTIDYKWNWNNRKDAIPCCCGTSKCDGIIGTVMTDKEKASEQPKQKNTARKRVATQLAHSGPEPAPSSEEPCVSVVSQHSRQVDSMDTQGDCSSLPVEFPSIIEHSSSEILRLLTTPPVPLDRPSTYRESHLFTAMESVYTIVQLAGSLRIIGGRVLECFRNSSNIVIFHVRSFVPGHVDHYMPRYVCFHYMEDAVFSMRNIYTQDELAAIRHYTLNGITRAQALALQDDLVLTYVQRFQSGDMPQTVAIRAQMNGPIAIGLPTHRLVPAPNTDNPSSSTPADDDISRDPAMIIAVARSLRSARTPQLRMSISRNRQTTTANHNTSLVPARTFPIDAANASSGHSLHTTNSDSDGDDPSRSVIETANRSDGYDHSFRMPLDQVIQMYDNAAIFRRMLDHAVENVTLLALSRLQPDQRLPHTDLTMQIRAELDGYYNLAPPHQRRFLLFTHYRMATEVYRPGSWNLQWCSLCGEHETFTYDSEQRRHFERAHSIVSTTYTCPTDKCWRRFHIPSHFRNHLATCNRPFLSSLRANMHNHIMDAMADYVAMREAGGRQLHIFTPGLPLLRNFGNQSRSHSKGKKSKSKAAIKMNVKEGKPLDNNIKTEKVRFGIQKTYTTLEKWNDLQYEDEDEMDEEATSEASNQHRRVVEGIVHDEERPGTSGASCAGRKQPGQKRSRQARRHDNGDVGQHEDELDEDEIIRSRSKSKRPCSSNARTYNSNPRSKSKAAPASRGTSKAASRGAGKTAARERSKSGNAGRNNRCDNDTESDDEVEMDHDKYKGMFGTSESDSNSDE